MFGSLDRTASAEGVYGSLDDRTVWIYHAIWAQANQRLPDERASAWEEAHQWALPADFSLPSPVVSLVWSIGSWW